MIYEYKCKECGMIDLQTRYIKDRDKKILCVVCNTEMYRTISTLNIKGGKE